MSACSVSKHLHPLLRSIRPLVDTPPVEHVGNLLIKILETPLNGFRLDGNTRRGKTFALERLARTQHWRRFPMWFFHVHFGKHASTTENYFFTTLLACARMRVASAMSPAQQLGRLAAYLAVEADKAGADIVVMPIDESQRLLVDDYEHLHTLDNALHFFGKRLVAVLIMQIDYLGDEPEKILVDIPRHARARFLMEHHAFIPVYRWTELQAYLQQYDEVEEWPPQSNIFFTQHFAPKAFAAGWRFWHQAEEIWTIATGQLALFALPHDPWAWPMQTLEPFATYLLTTIAGKDPDFMGFTDEHIRAALAHAKFIDFERECPPTLDPTLYVVGHRLKKYELPK